MIIIIIIRYVKRRRRCAVSAATLQTAKLALMLELSSMDRNRWRQREKAKLVHIPMAVSQFRFSAP